MESDGNLVIAARSGDRAAIAEIYDRYSAALFDMCARIGPVDEAGDAVQDTFVTAMDSLDQLREPDRLKPWLFSIARNRVRRTGRRRETPSETFELLAADSMLPEDEILRAEQAAGIEMALEGLEADDREVVLLRDRAGLDGAETAEVLGVERATVDRRLHAARRRLRQSFVACQTSRLGSTECEELRQVRGNDQFTPTVRKRVVRHVESCPICEETAERTASPAALFGALPILLPPMALRDRILDSLNVSHGAESGGGGPPADSPVDGGTHAVEAANKTLLNSVGPAAAMVAAVAVLAAIAWFTLGNRDPVEASAPTTVVKTTTTVVPTSATPAVTAPLPNFCDVLADSTAWFQANQGPRSPAPGDVQAYFTGSLARLELLNALAPDAVSGPLLTYTNAMSALVAQLSPAWDISAAAGGSDLTGLRNLLEVELPAQC